jgi:hypothetical protein
MRPKGEMSGQLQPRFAFLEVVDERVTEMLATDW